MRMGESMKVQSTASPEKREFFERMSADGNSPASLRAARITEADLQEGQESDAQATLNSLGKRIRKVSHYLFFLASNPSSVVPAMARLSAGGGDLGRKEA